MRKICLDEGFYHICGFCLILRHSIITGDHIKGAAMSLTLHRWIFIGSNAYDEYVFVPWLNRNVYLRTVDLSRVCVQ